VIFAHRLVLTGATRRTLVIALTTTRRTTAAITFWTLGSLWTLTALARRAGFTRRTWGVLTRLVVMRTLVSMNSGGMVIFRVLFGRHRGRFLLLASANDTFQSGLKAAEKGGFLRGVFGSAWGGHKRF
jgi:hypothetical protein